MVSSSSPDSFACPLYVHEKEGVSLVEPLSKRVLLQHTHALSEINHTYLVTYDKNTILKVVEHRNQQQCLATPVQSLKMIKFSNTGEYLATF